MTGIVKSHRQRFYILISTEWMINANDDYADDDDKQLKIQLPLYRID